MPRLALAPLSLCLVFAGAASAAAATSRPVVVELFTSEGCSSCPPAEAYLNALAQRPDVLPLAFHVTYWDRLGWKDHYSLEAATARQARYGARFGDGSYTPEMVVNGKKHLVGSRRDEGDTAIAAEAGTPSVAVEVGRSGNALTIQIGSGQGSGHVLLVGYDPEHRTAIGRGENTGRTVTESNVVRSVRTIAEWHGASLAIAESEPSGERPAVLLEAQDGRILGAARLP
ncbi:MAG: DUF1223 domain-containing protein [Janthinobacterium lividum]